MSATFFIRRREQARKAREEAEKQEKLVKEKPVEKKSKKK